MKKINEIKKKVVLIRKERRLYIKPDDVPKYREMGYTIRRGPRGGIYIDLDEKPQLRSVKGSVSSAISELKNSLKLFEKYKMAEEIEQIFKVATDFLDGKNDDADILFEEIDNVMGKLSDKFSNGEITEEEYREMTELLEKVSNKIKSEMSNDVLGIKGYGVVTTYDSVYEGVQKKLGVLSKFGNIDVIRYIGRESGKDVYYFDLGEQGSFLVSYDGDGSVVDLKFVIDGRVCNDDDVVCAVKWLDGVGREKIFDVINAFKEYYGTKEQGRRIVIEITRSGAKIEKIEMVKPFGRKGRVKWIIYLIIQAKKLGIVWQDIGELIHIMNKLGVLELIKEMFAVVG